MQDNNQYEFEEEFADQAWSQMRQVLDREMPVEDSPQRIAWVWWLMGLFVISSITLLGILMYQHKLQDTASEPIANPTIAEEQPITPSSGNTQEKSLSPAPLPDHSTEKSHTTNQKPFKLQQTDQTYISTSGELVRTNTPSPLTSSKPLTINEVIAPSSDIISSEELASEKASLVNTNSGEGEIITDQQKQTARKIYEIEQLNNLLQPIFYEAPLTDENRSIEPLTQKSIFKIGIEGSAYSLSPVKVHGFGAALVGTLKNKGHRTYLKTAVGYQVFQPDLIQRENILQFSNTALMPAPEGPQQTPPQSFLTETASVTELRYIYASISVGYQLTDKVSIEAGVLPSWLQASTLTETWSHTTGDNANPATSFVSRISDNNDDIRDSNLSLTAGLSYHINSSFSCNLEYQHGFRNLFISNADETYLRGAKFGLIYYIQ